MIQQLQATPKWKEFEEWYFNNYGPKEQGLILNEWSCLFYGDFLNLPLEFQKGVFEKFIESQGFIIIQWHKTLTKQTNISLFEIAHGEYVFKGTFEELLIWYFNN